MQNSQLDQNFTWRKLLGFTLPTILMMFCLSFYTTVDGIMVSRYVSENALAAVNIVYPVISLLLAIALMFATGANAIIAHLLGENKLKVAREKLTATYIGGVIVALVVALLLLIFMQPILVLLGASKTLMPYANGYLRIMLYFSPMLFLQIFTQTFMITEGKPMHGLLISMLSGVLNIALDYLFMAHFNWGIEGAALATGIGFGTTGLYGLLYFLLKKNSHLKFTRPKFDLSFYIKTTTNGASEMVNNLSVAFTTFLFNITMMRLLGNEGVVAITIILYLQFIQMAVYFGYSQGVSPLISYKFGAENYAALKALIKKSIVFITLASFAVIFVSVIFANQLIGFFVAPGSATFLLAKRGFLMSLTAYVFMGINIFMSALFTALGNGKTSAILSLMRTFVFLVGALTLLPTWLGITGVWLANPVAEALSFIVSLIAYYQGKTRYRY